MEENSGKVMGFLLTWDNLYQSHPPWFICLKKCCICLQVEPTEACSQAYTKQSFCGVCQGLTQLKPCYEYCENVMRGCLAHHYELNSSWVNYIGKVLEIPVSWQSDHVGLGTWGNTFLKFLVNVGCVTPEWWVWSTIGIKYTQELHVYCIQGSKTGAI